MISEMGQFLDRQNPGKASRGTNTGEILNEVLYKEQDPEELSYWTPESSSEQQMAEGLASSGYLVRAGSGYKLTSKGYRMLHAQEKAGGY